MGSKNQRKKTEKSRLLQDVNRTKNKFKQDFRLSANTESIKFISLLLKTKCFCSSKTHMLKCIPKMMVFGGKEVIRSWAYGLINGI